MFEIAAFNFPIAPRQASEHAKHIDAIFNVTTALTVFFTVIVLAFVIFFSIKYRVGSKANRERPQHENLKIEIAWSLPPLLLGIAIFAWGAQEFVETRKPPEDSMELFVMGKQWMWHIQHPNGVRENNELHVPVGVPIKLTMISQDVLHAFYLPEFRAQYHVVPGRYTDMWFTPTTPGRYYLFCNMHCGTQHSEMGGYVYVMSQQEYAQWLTAEGEEQKSQDPNFATPVEAGKHLYAKLNCVNCHTGVDTERAPTLYGIAGKQRKTNLGNITADDTYLRDSIMNPYNHMTSGYTNTMPAYKAQLTEEDALHLVTYIKSLGGMAEGQTQPGSAGQPQESTTGPQTSMTANASTNMGGNR